MKFKFGHKRALQAVALGGILWGALFTPQLQTSIAPLHIARADALDAPRDQAQLDALAASLDANNKAARDAILSRAGHAFDNGEAGLFWFTDLNAARAQAKREDKPILSLRLLGNLSDEYSCANSRLFRVLLYPNAPINRLLREKFVLHWSSERPVPVVTIDMGDGRVVKRTLTGNSAHYLLDENGQPLDVLPGLYAPADFAQWLEQSAQLAADWRAASASERPKMLADWHRARLRELYDGMIPSSPTPNAARDKWIQTQVAGALKNDRLAQTEAPKAVDARAASQLTVSKLVMEMPILDALGRRDASIKSSGLKPFAVAAKPFDAATRARIAATHPLVSSPAQSINTNGANAPLERLISALQNSVARDTQLNRWQMEPAIHVYFANGATPEFSVLNAAIYDKLFQTPASDPWLGLDLGATDVFVALRNGGVSGDTATASPRAAQIQRVAQAASPDR